MKLRLILGVLLVGLLGIVPAAAQSLTVAPVIIGSSGAVIGDATLSLDVTIGQAIVATNSSGTIELTAGFGGGVAALDAGGVNPAAQYLPIILNQGGGN